MRRPDEAHQEIILISILPKTKLYLQALRYVMLKFFESLIKSACLVATKAAAGELPCSNSIDRRDGHGLGHWMCKVVFVSHMTITLTSMHVLPRVS